MKLSARFQRPVIIAGIALSAACTVSAADPAPVVTDNPSAPAPAAAPAPVPAKLPYGVEDVLKLSRSQISDDVIVNYVKNSGTIYNLSPQDIVYLRDQGVSERVLNTMLDQRKRVELAVQPQAPAPVIPNAPSVANAPQVPDANSVPPAPAAADGTAYATAPLTPPASSVYVIPYPAASYAYYGPYGYYPYYYGGWYGPSVAFRFGFGGHGHYYGGHGSFAHGGHFGHR